ncbi:hypothetical protein COCNU_14G003970 [Cocos nucifera]|uniref:Uncharacterized protein n=1 Tax=Cocos nucifera TaxID=13894 RepID=A0A8K0NBX8_COCNU|nr:hypothetical protein COCNU_14G003970 [Cocos nucifera]
MERASSSSPPTGRNPPLHPHHPSVGTPFVSYPLKKYNPDLMASSSPPFIPLLDSPAETLAKRKKDPASVQEKLALLARNLRPVPFSPSKPLAALSPHKPLLRALGLWDFARLPLDRAIRSDLLSLLIAHYDPRTRHSLVRNSRVALGRAAFACALALPHSLPVEKEIGANAELLLGKAAVATVMDFMMNWMVFLDDACVLPPVVVAATRLVKEGRPQKVDWAGLVWAMAEREILDAPTAGRCYYASHLQCLMKRQRPQLFEEEDGEPEMDMELEPSIKVDLVEDEDGAGNGRPDLCPENCGLRSSLTLCRDVDAGNGVKEEPLDLEGKDVGVQRENLSKRGELLAMRTGHVHKKVMLDNGPSGVFLLGNNCMMVAGEANYDDDARVFDCIIRQKRMWSTRSCEHPQAAIDAPMEEAQNWMVEAKMMYLKKKQECMKVQLERQHLHQMLQQKDQIIWSLEKKRVEEMKKRKLEACQFDYELRVIGHLVHDYKKALKETRSAFAQYRKQFPEGDKPLYEDARGTGGAVVSARELEVQSMKKETEMHYVAAKIINDFQKRWFAKLGEYAKWATNLATRLVNLNGETKILREMFATQDPDSVSL